MKIEFDPEKNDRNIRDRGLSFERAADFDFGSAKFAEDLRRDYGERRYIALGMLDGRVHMLVFCEAHVGIRVISVRKANAREVKRYET
jgi:uncharacterized DUF497 family protein